MGLEGFHLFTGKRRVRADARPWTLFVLLPFSWFHLSFVCVCVPMGWDAADRYFKTRATNIADCEHVHIELTNNPSTTVLYHCDPQTNRDTADLLIHASSSSMQSLMQSLM